MDRQKGQHKRKDFILLCEAQREDFGRRNTAAQGRKSHLVGEAGQIGEDQEGSQLMFYSANGGKLVKNF